MTDLDKKAHQIVLLVDEFIPVQDRFLKTRERALVDKLKVLRATINVRLIEYKAIQREEKKLCT